MAKPKFDIVVEAVHYQADGLIEWVRAYQRRGPTFSDRVMLPRGELIALLKGGKRLVTGKRIPQMAGSFELGAPIQLWPSDGGEVLVAGDPPAQGDHLQGVPSL